MTYNTPIDALATYKELVDEGFHGDTYHGFLSIERKIIPKVMVRHTSFNHDGTGTPVLLKADIVAENGTYIVSILSEENISFRTEENESFLETLSRIENTITPFGVDASLTLTNNL